MKRCPYCAEEIQDAAVKCRFCGSDLARGQGESAQAEPTASGDRPLSLSHVGSRYAVGSGFDYHGIWDSQLPGRPIERFPKTDEGWAHAWASFRALEPAPAPVGASGVGRAVPPSLVEQTASASAAGPATQTNGPAVAALVLGIVGLVTAMLPVIGLSLGIIAVACSIAGFRRAEGTGVGRGFAVAGLVLGILATVFGLFALLALGLFTHQVTNIQQRIDQLPRLSP